MTQADGNRGEAADVLALQMDALYKAAPASILSISGALMAIFAYWSPDLKFGLILWVGCVSTVALLHLAGTALRASGRPVRWTPVSWARVASAIYFASGLSWGVGGAWMLGHGNEQQALVICCLAMGAVTVTFPAVVYAPAYNLFQVPIFFMFAIGLATSGMEFGALLSIASGLLCIFAAIIGQGMGSQLVLALRLYDENRKLAEELQVRGAALEAANRELRIQSLTDPLTGVANRRQLMSFARAAPERCAVLIVDVDHFKAYNDSFGHAEGDACLVLVAAELQASARPGVDLVARQGGEEFAIVLVDVDEDTAQTVAQQMRSNVEMLSDAHSPAIKRTVTVSIGLACRGPGRHRTIADLMADADAAVYEAKRSGRNRVCTSAAPSQIAVA